MFTARILQDQLTLTIVSAVLEGKQTLTSTGCGQEQDAAVILDAIAERCGGTLPVDALVAFHNWSVYLKSNRVMDWSVWHQLRYSSTRFDPLFLFLSGLDLLPPLF